MDTSPSKSPRKVLFLEAKKRGRPKRDEDHNIRDQFMSSLGLKKLEPPCTDSKATTSKKRKKNGSKKRKKNADDCYSSENDVLAHWIKSFQTESSLVAEEYEWVPGYKFCQLYSCFWCQKFSWDLKRCSNCKMLAPSNIRYLTVENSENFEATVDKARPLFHNPPVPYFQSGVHIIFCTSCFCFSRNLETCDICRHSFVRDAATEYFDIEFISSRDELSPEDPSLVLDFTPRKIDDTLMECPLCFFSTKADSSLCVHCHGEIQMFVKISQRGAAATADILKMMWPPRVEILSGCIKTLPPNYVPVYKENMLATCPSCSSLIFDLLRCTFCLRQLPKIKNLVALQPDSMYGISSGPVKPIFSPLPAPYYQPGKMSLCSECKNYSRNLRKCDFCGEKQRNFTAVDINFKSCKLNKNSKNVEKVVPYVPRMVNNQYYVCPHCDLSTDKEKCINCNQQIPSAIKIVELNRAVGKKGRNLQGKIILGQYKMFSLKRNDNVVNCGSITKKQMKGNILPLPNNYVPRYRHIGAVQCMQCLEWSWDFERCTICCHKIDLASVVVFPKNTFSHPAFDHRRPKIQTPIPRLTLGKKTLCPACLCFVLGPPECSECCHPIASTCKFYFIEADTNQSVEGHNWKKVKFRPSILENKSQLFCVFCGFSSENFESCSLCKKPFPQYCIIRSEDGSQEFPPELNFETLEQEKTTPPSTKKSDLQLQESKKIPAVDDEIVEAKLIVIHDWKAAVGLQEHNEARKWLESIPFAEKIDAIYDHQVSCFPDEIFLQPWLKKKQRAPK